MTERDGKNERDRDDEGNFSPRVDDDVIVEFVRETPTCTTTKIAEEFGYSQQGADYRLRQLKEAGRVDDVESIGRTNVWVVVGAEI